MTTNENTAPKATTPKATTRRMRMTRRMATGTLLSGALALGALAAGGAYFGTGAQAQSGDELCPITSGRVSVLANEFDALQAVVARAGECVGEGAEFSSNLTAEHKNIQIAALTANPAEYTSAVVANSSIVPLLNDDLIRPLDDLVAKYGQGLQPNQLITVNGKVMAVAFMANAQHLYFRTDILEQAGVEPPKTYEDVLAASKAIKEQGIMDAPFAMVSGAGWNLGEEFVNMYLGMGGEFFEPGSAVPAINNERGIAALEMMKALNENAGPDYLTYDSNAVSALWSAGEVAIAQHWGSRAASMIGEEETPDIAKVTMLAGAPTVGGNTAPASSLWWDGFTIAKNISDEDAEATFRAMVHGVQPGVLEGNEDKAVWLIEGYEPTPAAVGVAETAAAGAKPYPMVPYMGLMHTALGNELTDYLQGNESAEKALADVEAAYTTAARE